MGGRIHSSYSSSFVTIAGGTGETEIIDSSCSASRKRDDVLDFKGDTHEGFAAVAIRTVSLSRFMHYPLKTCWNPRRGHAGPPVTFCCKNSVYVALAFTSATRSLSASNSSSSARPTLVSFPSRFFSSSSFKRRWRAGARTASASARSSSTERPESGANVGFVFVAPARDSPTSASLASRSSNSASSVCVCLGSFRAATRTS